MKRHLAIGLFFLLALTACHGPQREARQMVRRAERLFDTDPDSTARLIDSVLRIPAYFEEGKRMDIAMLQAEALFGDRDDREISPLMDDEFFDDKPFLSTSPELERAADYYARKKKYDKAAHAALYSGFVQQHYGEKTHAMQSFKDAERYGEMVGDSLTVARAEYWMGKMLYDEGLKQEALVFFKKSDEVFGSRYVARAKVLNNMACCYLLCGQFDSTEMCLKHSLEYTQKDKSNQLRHKVLNNYAVLNRLQGNYDMALKNLQTIEKEIDSTEMPFLYLNKALVFVASNKVDSATCCFNNLKPFLLLPNVKKLTKASAYEALSRFAKGLGNDSLALHYRETHEQLLYEIMQQQQDQNMYRIHRQYDHENLQNTLNRKLIHRHRIIILISVFAILGLAALAVSQVRLAKIRKQEAEAKANLFHFMQQNNELIQRHEEYAKLHTDLMQKQSEKEREYQDYAEKYSHAKNKELKTIMKLAIYLKNMGELACLDELKKTVFDAQTPWEATFKIFDILYPDVRENLKLHYPELTEMEQKDFILSFFGISRQDEADMLGTTVHTVDKLRNSVRKQMKRASIEEQTRL